MIQSSVSSELGDRRPDISAEVLGSGSNPLFLLAIDSVGFLYRCMTHPLIPPILELAAPVATELGLELVGAVFQTSKRPPVLRVDIRNPAADTSLDDCERMSRALETQLDASELMPTAYVLEVSSPGTARELATEREFAVFQGFGVAVKTYAPYQGKKEWLGRLQGRDDQHVYLNQKGRTVAIPRQLVAKIQLDAAR